MRRAAIACILFTLCPDVEGPWAAPPTMQGAPSTPGAECRSAIERAERLYGLPAHLLGAIGIVESGRRDPGGHVDPWPWSINVEGTDNIFDSKADAIARVSALLAAGTRSIDVGCLQVNLMYHPDAFGSLDQAFDPWQNADYAARFLVQLHTQTGSWQAATASYHSATPELGGPYAAKVRAALSREGAAQPIDRAELMISPNASVAPSLSAVGRTGLDMALPATRLKPVMQAASTGRGLDAYRLYPTRITSALMRR